MNALTVCVEFHDYLAITLPRNLRYFDRILVVTTRTDWPTQKLVATCHDQDDRVSWAVSNAFFADGARFNKGAAIEEWLDRVLDGWCCVMDADVVLSPKIGDCLARLMPGNIYMPERRRRCTDPDTFVEYADSPALWDDLSEIPEMRLETHGRDGGAGYCQIFHASDPVLQDRPRYPIDWKHAGGCDTEFLEKWPPTNRIRLPFEVLHLGEDMTHWQGRRGRFLDGGTVPKSEERDRAMARMWNDRRTCGTKKERLGSPLRNADPEQ